MILPYIYIYIYRQEPLSKTPDFYAANDRMTETLRGPLLTAQREISALDIRRRVILQKVSTTEQEERGAYITATNWQETLQNTAKKAGYVGHHAKLKAEMGMVDVQIQDFKQVFGLELFAILMELEDKEGWLPTVRDIRSIYDQARRDIEKIEVRQKEKEAELIKLGGTPIIESTSSSNGSTFAASPDDPNKGNGTAGSYFKQIATVEAQQQQQQQQVPIAQAIPCVETIRSTGGPLSYSIPAMPSTTTTSSTMTTTTSLQQQPYPDPFGTSSSTPVTATLAYPNQQQHQQQQQLPPLSAPINPMFAYDAATAASIQQHPKPSTTNVVDPFAAMYNNNNHNVFGSIQQPPPLQPMGGNSSSTSSSHSMMQFTPAVAMTAAPIQQQQQQSTYVDPFASSFAQPSYTPSQYHSTVSDDPFAMLSQQQSPPPPQLPLQSSYQTQSSMNTITATNTNSSNASTPANPLFRY
jgi:hypothetical protein